MAKKFLLLIAAALILASAGCASETEFWCHPTKPMETAFPKENYECEGEAYKRAADLGDRGDSSVIKREWAKCMRSRGWSTCPQPEKK